MWLPYRLTQLLPTGPRLRKAWYGSPIFHGQRELKRRFTLASRMGMAASQRQSPAAGVTVARIIGNDLYPRHRQGQALINLQTILRNESSRDDWRKLFVLNRIVDEATQAQAASAVEAAGHDVLTIPFRPSEYQALRYRPELFGGADYFQSATFAAKDPFAQDRERIWACGDKIRYLMNINGARNQALQRGRVQSGWTLVLDGSCYITESAVTAISDDLSSDPLVPYVIIPMRRLEAGAEPEQADVSPIFREEPQIAFSADAREHFDENYPYGVRDKTSLLNRLGVPGPWCAWTPLAWYSESQTRSDERYLYKYGSAAVLRLTSGVNNGALEKPAAQMTRYRSRITAIFSTLMMVDRLCEAPDASSLSSIAGLPLPDQSEPAPAENVL